MGSAMCCESSNTTKEVLPATKRDQFMLKQSKDADIVNEVDFGELSNQALDTSKDLEEAETGETSPKFMQQDQNQSS